MPATPKSAEPGDDWDWCYIDNFASILMIALDGNAIGGDLLEVFGVDLTGAISVCAACGASAFIAEAVVYRRGPGRVARCRTCGECLIVLVTIRGITCVDMSGIAELQAEL